MPPLSILDLAFVPEGATPAEALRRALELAQHAEQWGYKRFWLAEHHNMPSVASAATSVVIGYIAGGTRTIRRPRLCVNGSSSISETVRGPKRASSAR